MVYIISNPVLKEKAKLEINENEDLIEEEIEIIKNWARQEPHLNILENDFWILNFLRGCKHSLERTKQKIDSHYTIKTMLPEFFDNRDPENKVMSDILDQGILLPIANEVDETAPSLFLLRYGFMDPSKVDKENLLRVSTMMSDMALIQKVDAQIAGYYVLSDLKGLTASHIPSIPLLKKLIKLFNEGYPHRAKKIILMNGSAFIDTILAMTKPLLTEKLRNRFVVVPKLEDLYDIVPKYLLPEEYGGTAGTVREISEYFKQKTIKHRDWFKDIEKYKVDEKKRPGKPKTYDELFGIEGSFKKLNVD